MAKEEQLMMESAFHRLTEEEQRLLASYLRDGCTFSELGHQFGCSEEAARKRWGRALFRWQQMTQAHHA